MIGRTLSHYKVLNEISRGGMGIVYKALDLKLNREVALKVLPPELVSDRERKRRFIQEAQAAAVLKHPNIAVIYEVDEVDGETLIAMELIEGEKLGHMIQRGPLAPHLAMSLAKEVAEGLSAAHKKHIIHRDLKPSNIMVSADGNAKIIDFGLAKLVEPVGDPASHFETAIQEKTAAGAFVGTPSYMSPEQARGQPVDHRTDIFSFGIVLFEMITGRHPFERGTPADTLSAILNEEPVALAAVPRSVRAIVERCLAKQAGERFLAASDLAEALANAEVARRQWRSPVRFVLVATLLVSLMAGTWLLSKRDAAPPPPRAEVLSILIADFDNRTGESVFDGAIEQALAISLEGASFITAFERSRARDQAATLSPANEGKLDEAMARLVCRSQGIELAITGSVESDGSEYRVRVSALDPVTVESLVEASETIADKASVLRAVDRLASTLRAALGDVEPMSRLAYQEETFTAASLEAMHAYAAGQSSLHSGNFQEAIRRYNMAIAADADFGRAYAGLGVALVALERRDEARVQFDRALSLLHRMSDREKLRTRGVYYLFMRNYRAALDEYTELLRKFPADSTAMVNLAFAHFYERHFDQALDFGRRAALTDNSLLGRLNVAIYATYADRLEDSIEEANAVIKENPEYHYAYVTLALARLANGEPDKATEVYARLSELGDLGASLAAIGLADAALYEGKRREAEQILRAAVGTDLESGNKFAAAKKLSVLAEILILDGNESAGREAMQRALSLSQDVGTRFGAAMIYLQAGERSLLLEIVTALTSQEGSESKALAGVLRGEAALLDGDPETAVARLLEAREIADTWLGRFALGRAYLERGSFAEANSELETCLRRKGEATALFLDDVPSFRIVPEVHYYLGRSLEGLGSKQGAADSYREFLRIKESGEETPLTQDAARRFRGLQ